MIDWRRNWIRVWLGALMFGVIGYFAFGALNQLLVDSPIILGGLLLAAIVGLIAWWFYRAGRHEMAVGLIGGYAILSLISGGQCTLLLEPDQGLEGGAIIGFFLYPALLIVTILIGGIATLIIRWRSGREGRS